MVTYFCTWCGTTATRPTRNETVRCGRCVEEALRLFRFWPWTVMVPLAPGETQPKPRASQVRFEFREVATGAVRGRTDLVAKPRRLRPVPL